MKDYQIKTYEEAKHVIAEIGFLPLAPLVPHYPSLDSITEKAAWHTGSEFDPWLWRAQFPADGSAAYGKFFKKKAVLLSGKLLPLVHAISGNPRSLKSRYEDGLVSRDAFTLFTLISEEEGIDTRVLRARAGMKEKEQKKNFDDALLELQGSLDIVVSGTKEKTNSSGEKNGWSSSAFETMSHWSSSHSIELPTIGLEMAKTELKHHFAGFCDEEAMKALGKLFKF